MPTHSWVDPAEPAVPPLQLDTQRGAVTSETTVVMFRNLDLFLSAIHQPVAG